MNKNLTHKQLKFIDEYIKNGFVKVRAALAVYDTDSYKVASKIADTNCNNPLIKAEIDQRLSDAGITGETVAEKLKEGLEATLTHCGKDKKMVVSTLPDMATRYKYLVALISVMGLTQNCTDDLRQYRAKGK